MTHDPMTHDPMTHDPMTAQSLMTGTGIQPDTALCLSRGILYVWRLPLSTIAIIRFPSIQSDSSQGDVLNRIMVNSNFQCSIRMDLENLERSDSSWFHFARFERDLENIFTYLIVV
jgi:hypothetical protein